VVPRAKAEAVAAAAHRIQEDDKDARRGLYKKLHRAEDFTTQ
jgi:hypothetical protein